MLRAAVKLHCSRGSGLRWVGDPVFAFYPGARYERGPQRLLSLDPDPEVAVPSS
jgi:hypothetical protein